MSARNTREPGPNGFTWRGIKLVPVEGLPRTWASSPSIDLGDRGGDWRVEQPLAEGGYHARLRIGRDRYPGVGATAAEALTAAAGEAALVATFIVAMLPEGKLPGLPEQTAPRRSKRPRRAKKASR